MSYVKGQFRKEIFKGDNGYMVSLFKIDSKSDDIDEEVGSTITITGYFHEKSPNDTYQLNGELVSHPKYGKQFKTDNYTRLKPEGKDAMIEFLSSDIFPGIGEKTAAKVVEMFKDKTFDVILNHKEDLYMIPKLSEKNIETLNTVLIEYESSYKILLDLGELGFSTKDAVRISNYYKSKTEEIVKKNIYKLLEIKDIGFRKIDEIAIKNDYLVDDPRRIEAAIVYSFTEVAMHLGHCYLDYEQLFSYLKRALYFDLSIEQFDECIYEMIESKELIREDDRYYLVKMHEDEEYVALRINYLLQKKKIELKTLTSDFEKIEKRSSIKFSNSQKEAILNSQETHFEIITGGPGTGKTTIVKAIVDLYQASHKLSMAQLQQDVALLSPTGRASKRLSEATMMPASTIHRFLKWNKDNDNFQLNERNKSLAKLLIIDESSMIDISLLAALFRALRMDCRVIMVGDYQQLPSVGPGQVLKDIIASDVSPVIFLNELYRQAKDSEIISLAYGVNSGHLDFELSGNDLIYQVNEDIITNLKEICSSYKKANYRDFQILVPMYKGLYGIDTINKIAQELFNPADSHKREIKYFELCYREGDKVLQLVNMPDDNVYNGDIGLIKKILPKEIVIDFDGNIVTYGSSDFANFTHAYAISIHKAQGSEFKVVVLPLSYTYHKMLYRKLYYTAVSRAKTKLYILGDPKILARASANDKENIRQTSLADKLKNKYLILNKN